METMFMIIFSIVLGYEMRVNPPCGVDKLIKEEIARCKLNANRWNKSFDRDGIMWACDEEEIEREILRQVR